MINIDELIKESMKTRDKTSLRAYQNLKAEIQKFKTAKNAKPYEETTELGIISKYCKSLEEAIKQFSEARRDDLVAEYSSELGVLQKLLPASANESEIYSELCEWQISMAMENNWKVELDRPIIPKKEMGNAIKYLKSKFPTADGKIISEIVKKYLI